jgi:hypothetical protein
MHTTPSELRVREELGGGKNGISSKKVDSQYFKSPSKLKTNAMTPVSHPKPHHYVTAKVSSTKTPSSAATKTTSESASSVYDRLYACRKSPSTKGASSPSVVADSIYNHNKNNQKSPQYYLFNNKSKEGELRTKARRIVMILQELKTHPLFLKNAPLITSCSSSNNNNNHGITSAKPNDCDISSYYSPIMNTATMTRKKKKKKNSIIAAWWKEEEGGKETEEINKMMNVACTQIQRIYRGYCTMTLLATISVIYATVIIQCAYRRHRYLGVAARTIQCTYRRYRSTQCYQLRLIKNFLEESKKDQQKPFLLRRIFSHYW